VTKNWTTATKPAISVMMIQVSRTSTAMWRRTIVLNENPAPVTPDAYQADIIIIIIIGSTALRAPLPSS
jgi:hypothetical protein